MLRHFTPLGCCFDLRFPLFWDAERPWSVATWLSHRQGTLVAGITCCEVLLPWYNQVSRSTYVVGISARIASALLVATM